MNALAIDHLAAPVFQPADHSWFTRSWRFSAIFGFAAWVLIVGSHHEPWVDEAQAWLLARDSSLGELLVQRVRYEGTPGLWHTVLWFSIRAGLPYKWLFVLPSGFAIAGAAVILWRAPFPAPLRVMVLTSYFYGYQFSVVARSYCIDLLLVPLAATFFADRVERPVRYAIVIGLIANTNAHGFLVGCVLGIELIWQAIRNKQLADRQTIVGLSIAAGLGLLALLCAWQPSDNSFLQPQSRANPIMTVAAYLCNAFVDHVALWNPALKSKYDVFASVLLTCLLQRPVIALIWAGKNRFLAVGVMSILLLFAVVVYASLWHAGLFFLFWLFILWVEWGNPLAPRDRRQLIAAVALILSLQSIQTLRTGLWDVDHVYAPGQQSAQAIIDWRATHPGGRIFGYGDYIFCVQPWLDRNPFANYHNGDKHISYLRWDRHEPWMAGAWDARTKMNFWHQVLAAQPDLIVASMVNRNWTNGSMTDLIPEASQAGYTVREILPGTMVWRGGMAGDQSVYLFERRTSSPHMSAPTRI